MTRPAPSVPHAGTTTSATSFSTRAYRNRIPVMMGDVGRSSRRREGPAPYRGSRGMVPAGRQDRRYDDSRGRQGTGYPEAEAADSWETPASRTGRPRGRVDRQFPASREYPVRRPQALVKAGGVAPSRSSSKPRSRRFVTVFVPVAAILVIAAAALGLIRYPSLLARLQGGAATSDNAPPFIAYTPGPTPTAPAGFKEFDSARSLYVLDYPQSWDSSSGATSISWRL